MSRRTVKKSTTIMALELSVMGLCVFMSTLTGCGNRTDPLEVHQETSIATSVNAETVVSIAVEEVAKRIKVDKRRLVAEVEDVEGGWYVVVSVSPTTPGSSYYVQIDNLGRIIECSGGE